MSFAGPPEDDIDWKDVSPQASAKFLARAWRVAKDVSEVEELGEPDKQVRVATHSFLNDFGTNIENFKFNVAVAKTMELVNALRKAIDSGCGAQNPAVREGAEELAKGLSLFAPYVAEDMWHILGHDSPVALAGFRDVEKDLLVQDTVTAVAQVNGKLRDKFEVSVDVSDAELEQLALGSENVKRAIGEGQIVKVIVKAPKLVNIAVKG
jgi:leucyl-tRNA synthetase